MASPSRRSNRDLTAELAQDPTRFGFFQAVRVLSLSKPGRQRQHVPGTLRFRTPATLSFPASELGPFCPVKQSDNNQASDTETAPANHELTVNFTGLTGPSGALPTHYTELLIERKLYHRDTALHAFFDLFSHRATALFFSAWRKYRFWIAAEAGEQDGFSRYLLDMGGLGLNSLRQQMKQRPGHGTAAETHVPARDADHDLNHNAIQSKAVQNVTADGKSAHIEQHAAQDEVFELNESLFMYYAGLLSQKPLSGQALVTLIEGFFGVPAAMQQFAGQWLSLPQTEQSQLGGNACELGVSTFAGDRVRDHQSKLGLQLGPLRRAQYDALQEGEPGADALKALLQFAFGHNLSSDVTLILDQRDVPAPALNNDAPPRLGINLWLGQPLHNPDDRRFALVA